MNDTNLKTKNPTNFSRGSMSDVHHIIPYRVCKEHELNNLITLCVECHNTVETWDVKTLQEVKEKIRKGV